MFVANDFPYLFPQELIERFNIPQLWQERSVEGLGEYTLPILWNWPMDFLYGLFGKLNINFSVIQLLIVFIPFILIGIYSIKGLLNSQGIKGWPAIAAGMVYLVNSYILLLLDGGQFSIALAYAIFPLCFYLITKCLEKTDIKNIIYASLSVVILGIFDIRFIYLLSVLLLINIFFNKYKFTNILKTGFGIGVIFIGINAFWLFPTFLANAPVLPETYGRGSQVESLTFANIGHAILLLSPHWYKNIFGQVTPLIPLFVIIPVLAFLAPIVSDKNKKVGFWLVIALISIFLVKGTSQPAPGIYSWLFENLPGFSLFRDPTKFYFLVSLSFSVLVGLTLVSLNKRFKYVSQFIIALLVILASPVFLGKMTGSFNIPTNQNSFFNLANTFTKDDNFSRILWLPSRPPLGYASPTHPNLEASRLGSKRPFAIGVVGTYETLNFLRDAPFMGQILDIAGIGYIGYPFPDSRRNQLSIEQKDYYDSFLKQLESLPWVEKTASDFPVPVLKTKNNKDRFFISPNTFYIIGSDRIYWDMLNIDFSKNAFVFAEEHPGVSAKNVFNNPIILYDKNLLDAQLSFVSGDMFNFPASILKFDPDHTGWWKRESSDLIWWKDFLEQKYGIYNLDFDYGGGWAISEGQNTLKVSDTNFISGKTLYVRAMESSRGGEISIYQNDNLIGKIDTKIKDTKKIQVKLTGNEKVSDQVFEYDSAIVKWFEIGNLVSDSPITIKTLGEINVINALVPINKGELPEVKNTINLNDIDFSKSNNAKVTYTRLSPTHYKITVKGLDTPATLAFSETFNSNWELNGQKPVKLYSLINGFYIEGDGEYDLYFAPQKYIIPGLTVSLITLIISIILLRWKSKATV